jgi:hypothetical protein
LLWKIDPVVLLDYRSGDHEDYEQAKRKVDQGRDVKIGYNR